MNSTPEPALRVALYARISKDRNGEQEGVTRQVDACRDLAEQRGWTVVAEHVDNDISAYSGKKRPGFLGCAAGRHAGRAGRTRWWSGIRTV